MNRRLSAFASIIISAYCVACGSNSAALHSPVVVSVAGAFQVVEAGGTPITLKASVTGSTNDQGIKWTLSSANTSCSPACGTLTVSATLLYSAVYTPPATVPTNQEATITARSVLDDQQVFAFNFQITPPITVSVAPKFSSQTAGGPVVNLTATITNDLTNAGVSWTLTAGSAPCPASPCGTLTFGPTPSLTAQYQPPVSLATGTSVSPTITVVSVADSSKSDSFGFTVAPPPLSVAISNKFSTAIAGGSSILVSAIVNNDTTGAGVTWTLGTAGGSCSPASACGTLTPSAAPSFSATYTPPTAAPSGANAAPTISAISVTDPTKSDSFSFNIVTLNSIFKGSYAFQLRGYDSSGTPMAMAGSLTSDGSGNVIGGELDLNDNGTTSLSTALSGSYTLDNSFNGIPRVTINLASGVNSWVLRGAVSGDGTRGRIVELDGSLRLNAGTLLLQDPAALAAANPSGTYVFGLDSDAGISTSTGGVTTTGRIVEAGQMTIGPGATSITGGVADAGQAAAPAVLFGGGATPASINSGAATAPDASGRGTFTLTINGNANTYAYYVVNAQLLNLIETDSGGTYLTVQSGTAQLQQAITATTLNATSVVALTGTTVSSGSTAPSVIVGVLTVSGGDTPAPSVTASFEYNSAGHVPPSQTPVSAVGSLFNYNQSTGRLVLVNTLFFGAAVYLSDVGKGYVVDVTPSQNGANVNHAFSGPLLPQAPGPFSLQSHVYGNYIGLAGGSSSSLLPNFDIAGNFDVSGVHSDVIDFTTPIIPGQCIGINCQGQAPDEAIDGQFILSDPSSGLGVISFPAGAFGDFTGGEAVFLSYYIIGPHQLVAIGQGIAGNGGDPSGVIFFDPQ